MLYADGLRSGIPKLIFWQLYCQANERSVICCLIVSKNVFLSNDVVRPLSQNYFLACIPSKKYRIFVLLTWAPASF